MPPSKWNIAVGGVASRDASAVVRQGSLLDEWKRKVADLQAELEASQCSNAMEIYLLQVILLSRIENCVLKLQRLLQVQKLHNLNIWWWRQKVLDASLPNTTNEDDDKSRPVAEAN